MPNPPLIRNEIGSKIQTKLYCLPSPRRQGEGGLRLHGKFKTGGYFEERIADSQVQPLVSIITVVYNGVAHLEKTILSVLNQGYDNVEYIVIDGGSTDGTLEVLRKYEHAIDYWVSEPDGGISNAFNKGLSVSTGRLVGFINADDWYESGAIQFAVSRSTEHDVDIIHGQLQYWSGTKAVELFSGNHDLLERDMTVNHPTVISRLAIYRNVGGFSPDFRYAMDYEWLRRAKSFGAKFYYVATPLANMSLGGISDIRWKRAIREVARVKVMYSSNNITPWISYGVQLTRGIARKVLDKIGLKRIVRFYHARVSLISKTIK
jgi:glycosyltransferase involved in cell wall biosynthesis